MEFQRADTCKLRETWEGTVQSITCRWVKNGWFDVTAASLPAVVTAVTGRRGSGREQIPLFGEEHRAVGLKGSLAQAWSRTEHSFACFHCCQECHLFLVSTFALLILSFFKKFILKFLFLTGDSKTFLRYIYIYIFIAANPAFVVGVAVVVAVVAFPKSGVQAVCMVYSVIKWYVTWTVNGNYLLVITLCKRLMESSRLEVGNNQRAAARYSCFVLLFRWYLLEPAGVASRFFRTLLPCFSDVQHNNT